MQIALQEGSHLSALLQVEHLPLALTDQTLIEQRGSYPGQWRFTGCIDIEQYQCISIVEGRTELLQQQVRAGIAMRLKDHYQACLRPDRFGGPQRLTNLLGMVTIVVHDRNAVAYPAPVKAPMHAA